MRISIPPKMSDDSILSHSRSSANFCRSPFLDLHLRWTHDDDESTMDNVELLHLMEEEVLVSAQARLDAKRLQNTVLSLILQDSDQKYMGKEERYSPHNDSSSSRLQFSRWNVALASGSACFVLLFVTLHHWVPAMGTFIIITYIASRDPVMEEDGDGLIPSFVGPFSRLLGFSVLEIMSKISRKVRILGRALLSDADELDTLRDQVYTLEQTNRRLNQWIQLRMYVDDNIGDYSLEELRDLSRNNNLTVSGSKAQLMMRLLQKGILKTDES
jgi:hypothetical protein